jgi:hypothetical protein
MRAMIIGKHFLEVLLTVHTRSHTIFFNLQFFVLRSNPE